MNRSNFFMTVALLMQMFLGAMLPLGTQASELKSTVHYRSQMVDGVKIFYREAGDARKPALVLLHGFPTSSHMFRNLIPRLAKRYYVIAPDYPGFGQSSMPARENFEYSFDNLSGVIANLLQQLNINRYALYLMDYGGPVGFRIAVQQPEKVSALIIQNSNAYDEGLQDFWIPLRALWTDNSEVHRNALRPFLELSGTRYQYTHGVSDLSLLSPDTWTIDQYGLDRTGNKEIQLDLFYDYRRNVVMYPIWQDYLRTYQPPTLIVWGKNDEIFPKQGAIAYQRDLPNAEIHLLNTGHFALETHGEAIAKLMLRFLRRALH